MMEDEFGFDPEPDVEDMEVGDLSDVGALIEEDVIGMPQEYGFNSAEQMYLFLKNLVAAPRVYEKLQDDYRERWDSFLDEYDEAGGVIYNPENGDEWYTDDPELLM